MQDALPVKKVVVTSLSILLLLSDNIKDGKDNILTYSILVRLTTQKPKVKSKLCYTPDADLIKFLEERLNLLKKQKTGKKSTLEDSKLKRNNDSKKVRRLNDYIFPSMANLIAFFEYMKNNPELQKDFEEDIQELLFGVGPDSTPAFARLFSNAMQWNDKIRIIFDSYYLSRYKNS